MNRAVFCDRDGVINVDHGYVHRWDEFDIIPGVPEALSALRQVGWLLVLVTNQSGIARGLYNEQAFHLLTQQMQDFLQKQNAQFDAVYFCPHLPEAPVSAYARACECRKPVALACLNRRSLNLVSICRSQSVLVTTPRTCRRHRLPVWDWPMA